MAMVVLDPGHGGTAKIGGSSPNNAMGPTGTLEKWLTLDLARRVRGILRAAGIETRLTRDEDRNLGLQERAAVAKAARADAFVSIHLNGFDRRAQGTETYYHAEGSGDSRALAGFVQAAVLKATGLADRGVKTAGYGVVRPDYHAPSTAACLVEISFMDVAAEEARLKTDAYKDAIARALAAAIRGWLVADQRMAGGPEFSVAATSEPQDGFETELRLVVAQAPPVGGAARQPAPQPQTLLTRIGGDAPVNRGEQVPFFAEPGDRSAAVGGSGVTDLDQMLKGWRKERLSPEIAIDGDDSLDAVFVELLSRKRRSVGIVRASGTAYNGERGKWTGTGFLVSPNILLTNHHVLNSPEVAQSATVAFDYEISAAAFAEGDHTPPAAGQEYGLSPDKLFITSPFDRGLDYTFVWVDGVQPPDGGIIRMERAAFSVLSGERAFLIHHPNGYPKRVSLEDPEVVAARPDGAVIHYTTDSQPGSSGSPTFDRTGRLIALHHASRDNVENLRRTSGTTPAHLNEGVKIAAIALDLETRRRTEPNPMFDIVLGEIYGSDTLAGFFGAAGRTAVAPTGAERVVDIYNATAQDVDVGFWNVEWFANRYREKADEVASTIVDLGLDIWALIETSPEATEALALAIERKFGQRLEFAHSEPGADSSRQTTSVLWNPKTVKGERLAWPAPIDQLFRLRSEDIPSLERQAEPKPGKLFDRYPGLFHFKGLGGVGGGIDFNLVPLHLKAMDEGWERRRGASYALAKAVDMMIRDYHADQDWVLGGDWNAELASGDFDALVRKEFTPVSAQDEADGALTYLKSPRSLIDHVFLSPNMSRLYGQQDYLILAKEKSQVDYLKRFSDHRPVMLRLSARSAQVEAVAGGPSPIDRRITSYVDAVLGQGAPVSRNEEVRRVG